MRRALDIFLDLKPAVIGASTTVILEHLNAVVGLLVGCATLVWLVLRIRKELGK